MRFPLPGSCLFLFMLVTTAVAAPQRSYFSGDGTISENSNLFKADQVRFEKYTFAGKRGDQVSVTLTPADSASASVMRLKFNRGQGLETARYDDEDDMHRFHHEFAEDGTLEIYATTRKPGQTGRYSLLVEAETRLAPPPLYMYLMVDGEANNGFFVTYPCIIDEHNLPWVEVEVAGLDYLPRIDFGTGLDHDFKPRAWAERRERGNTVWGKGEGPSGDYSVRIRPQPTVGGSFRLTWMFPLVLTREG